MSKKPPYVSKKTSYELDQFIHEFELDICRLVVEGVSKNINKDVEMVPIINFYVEDVNKTINMVAYKVDFEMLLNDNLIILEKYDMFEECIEVKNIINQIHKNEKIK